VSNSNARRVAWHYILLWLIVLISIGLNLVLLYSLYSFRLRAQREVTAISQMLETVELNNYEMPIAVSETLPLSLTIPFSDTFAVPISTTIPISTSIAVSETIAVPITDVVTIDRDVEVSVVILGQRVPVQLPVRADIPINLNAEVPVNLQVPVQLEIPVNLPLEVPVQTSVPIEANVPVQLDFPVTIPLDEMGFTVLLQQVKDALRLLAAFLGAPGT
jgi:hypothetical protein